MRRSAAWIVETWKKHFCNMSTTTRLIWAHQFDHFSSCSSSCSLRFTE